MADGPTALGIELGRLRVLSGLTQHDVAEKIGHGSPSTVSQWETSPRRPGPKNLAKLAVLYGVTLAHLRQFGAYDPIGPRMTRRQREAAQKVIDFPATPSGESRPSTQLVTPDKGDEAMLNALGERGRTMLHNLLTAAGRYPRSVGKLYNALDETIDAFIASGGRVAGKDHRHPGGGRSR